MKNPNILFLFPDQWRWDFLGCAESGVPVSTPNLDQLAARGLRFTQCRTNAPVCAPARACLTQGVRYERCGVPGNQTNSDPSRPNFMKQLQAAGYRTAGCGKFDLFKPALFRGLDGWTAKIGEIGFDHGCDQSGKLDCARHGWPEPVDSYSAFLHARNLMKTHFDDYRERHRRRESGNVGAWPTPLPREAHTDEFTTRNALHLLEELPRDQPWYLWVNFPGPHDPFDAPTEFRRRYDDVSFTPPVHPDPAADPEEILHQQRSYAACCEHIDELCGKILEKVRDRGEWENTVVILSSDHGEMLGEHGHWTKSVPCDGSVHVPLILAGPGIPEGRTCDALVELIDLAGTITDLSGADPVTGWDSRSLAPLFADNRAPHREITVSALGNWRSAFDGVHKLILEDNQPTALYHLKEDPRETVNRLPQAGDDTVSPLMDALENTA